MTPEAQRIAIAKAVGIKIIGVEDGVPYMERKYDPKRGGLQPANQPVPDYLNDLNAMHEAIILLRFPQTQSLWKVNQCHLEEIVSRENNIGKDTVSFQWECQNAAATQRAEAFLKTMRKWTDD